MSGGANKDFGGVIKKIYNEDSNSINIKGVGGILVTEPFDYVGLSYILSGPGIGEVGAVEYKQGGSGGTLIATLTLTYNGSNKLISVEKT